jgi:hypothetical protein
VLRGNGIRAAVGVGGSRVPRAPIVGVDRGHDAPPSGSGRRVVPSVTGIGAWPSWLGVGPAGVGTSASLAARAVMASRSPSSAWRSSSVRSSCSSICSIPLLTSGSCPLWCSWGGRRGSGRRRGGGALGEEVVAAVAVAEVVVLPGLPAGGGTAEDGLAVDEKLLPRDVNHGGKGRPESSDVCVILARGHGSQPSVIGIDQAFRPPRAVSRSVTRLSAAAARRARRTAGSGAALAETRCTSSCACARLAP